MNIGSKIQKMRKEKNMTQQELAEKLFVSDKTVSSWELNRTEPNLELLFRISEIFSCSISSLVYDDVLKNDIETEIKIKITEKEYNDLKLFLDNNASFLNENKQLDTYYQPMYRNFVNKEKIESKEKISEWLRIGKRGNKNILNYKNWYDNYCDEFEVEIDNVLNMEKIFKVLDIEELIKVDKNRKTYLYLNKYEIALDNVQELGYFIEIEIKKYTKPINEEYDLLLKVAKSLNLNLENIDRRGYPYYMLENKYQKNT